MKYLKTKKIVPSLQPFFFPYLGYEKSALQKRYTTFLLPKKYKLFDISMRLLEIKQGSKKLEAHNPNLSLFLVHELHLSEAKILNPVNNFNNDLPF